MSFNVTRLSASSMMQINAGQRPRLTAHHHAAPRGAARATQHHNLRAPRVHCFKGDDHGAERDMSDGELRDALVEAAQLFQQAQDISHLQVQHDLELAFADTFSQPNPTGDTLSEDAMISFWTEQGLSNKAASRLFRDISQQGKHYSLGQLSAKLQRWQRVLPDVDIAALAYKDSNLLDADISAALRNMVLLVERFPGKDVVQLLFKQPKLLWADDLRDRISRVTGKLVVLHPSKDETVVRDIIFEYPELLFRMDYYANAQLIDELPIEIQNMMIVADQGIGFLHRYYRNKRTNYAAEAALNSNFGQPSDTF